MPTPDRSNALDHVVVVMFENRSFDNLLGRLYEPGEVDTFEGVIGKDLSNPIPEWAEHGAQRGSVAYGIAKTMDTPNPDPGEEYQHVNTQLFGIIDPPSNRGVLAEHMTAPFNLPADPHATPTMDGFVTDYISAYTAEMGVQPTYEQYAQIMQGYTPEQMPVLSTIAVDSRPSTTGSPRSRRRRSRTGRSSTPPPRPGSSSMPRTRPSPA